MTRNRIWVVVPVALVLGVLLLVVIASRATHHAVSPITSVQFTNAITHQAETDIVDETSDLQPGVISSTSATIDGIHVIYDRLTPDQAVSAQSTIRNFLLARSGLGNVHAGILADSFTQHTDNLQFILVSDQPQAKYEVTISTTSQLQSIPTVTFGELEQ